jgi:uracil phosphoribosyltransferase
MNPVFILNEQAGIGNEFVRELRDKDIQTDRMRFRRNVERLGEIMAHEVSRRLDFIPTSVETPLGKTTVQTLAEQPVLITVLRAGLPFFQGFLNYFDKADCGFVGAYRQEGTGDIKIKVDYAATPGLQDRQLILIDPMLATGRSAVDALALVLKKGIPRHVHVVSLIAAREGIAFVRKNLETPHSLYTCAVDEALNSQFYIVPGLGDAGDLSFGEKI